jgi:hypothetical protein
MASIGGGWAVGPPSSSMNRHRARRDTFLTDHPEWSIVYIRQLDQYEASSGTTDTELVILTDKHLGELMDRLETRYTTPEAEADGQAPEGEAGAAEE